MARQPFRDSLLAALEEHGVRPVSTSDPRQVHSFLNRLYVFQITGLRLKRRELESFFGPQPLDGYRAEVEALCARYSVLSVPLDEWPSDE